jgi:tryptophanyl-tRNA synthetase
MNSLVFSGVQPTGNLHLGNYLGAIKNWVGLQHQHASMFCIVDMHAITVFQDPIALQKAIRETAAAYIACGIDPEKSIVFVQSTVSAHAELAWILNCHTPLGWLNRMTQFKEKAQQSKLGTENVIKFAKELNKRIRRLQKSVDEGMVGHGLLSQYLEREKLEKYCSTLEVALADLEEDIKNSSVAKLGLYSYPVLMAADILAYKATHVPVGEDQKQHLELARDIAGAFNRAYPVSSPPCSSADSHMGHGSGLTRPTDRETSSVGGFFPLPEPLILGEATRVMSLRDGTKKMSKSDESDFSRIHLMDDADTILQKIKKAKSDMEPGPIRYNLAVRPEASNLITIYAAVRGISRAEAETEIANDNFSAFKTRLAEALIAHLAPIRAKMVDLLADAAELDRILKKGSERAADVANPILKEVKKTIGFPI